MRFALKTLFAGVSLSCFAVYLLTAAPPTFALPALVFIWVTLAAFFTAGLIYGRGNIRAFCVGAMFPAGATMLALTWMLCMWFMTGPYELKDWSKLLTHFDNFAFTMRVWSGAGWIMIGLVGLTSVAARVALGSGSEEPGAGTSESSVAEQR